MDRRLNVRTDCSKVEWMAWWIAVWLEELMKGMDRIMDGWTGRRVSGYQIRWMAGQIMEGWTIGGG